MDKRINRKGQVQMGETVAVVVIVIILLVIGISFWGKISRSGIEDIQEQSQELSVIEIANMVSELPELKCYEADVDKVKCLDKYKIDTLSEAILEKDDVFRYYNDYFMNSKITVRTIYPDVVPIANENVTLYDAKLNNNTRTIHISIPVNIVDDVKGITSYGLIIVEGYYKE